MTPDQDAAPVGAGGRPGLPWARSQVGQTVGTMGEGGLLSQQTVLHRWEGGWVCPSAGGTRGSLCAEEREPVGQGPLLTQKGRTFGGPGRGLGLGGASRASAL